MQVKKIVIMEAISIATYLRNINNTKFKAWESCFTDEILPCFKQIILHVCVDKVEKSLCKVI